MGLLRLFKKHTLFLIIFTITASSCGIENIFQKKYHNKYNGTIELSSHRWLKGKKIFIDPGHGGKGASDPFRIGPNGIREEEINLRVSLILADMLQRTGAVIKMSRNSDMDIPLDERVKMVKEFEPEILISIHHNGSPRREDCVNYPTVLIWGSRHVRPASYDFAGYLLKEFHKIMDERGKIISDFSVFSETGTRILRKTRYICPGVIGEAGFFSHKNHAERLKDRTYNEREAEAYFNSISRYFKWGIPEAEVLFSCPVYKHEYLKSIIKDRNPLIAVRVNSGNESKGIYYKTLKITMDGIPVKFKRISDNLFLIKYGKTLYPGGHSIRFHFRNLRFQSSMVLHTPFTVEIKKGDYCRLIKRGKRLIKRKRTAREGLKMLLSALSMGLTGPEADTLLWNISRGFRIIKDYGNSEYYRKKLYYFYPQSKYSRIIGKRISKFNSFRYPVDYYGKKTNIIYGCEILRCR